MWLLVSGGPISINFVSSAMRCERMKQNRKQQHLPRRQFMNANSQCGRLSTVCVEIEIHLFVLMNKKQ